MPLKWMIWGYPYFRTPPNMTGLLVSCFFLSLELAMEFESCLNELQHWKSANLCHILGGKLERCTRRVAPMSPLRVPTWATSPSSSRHSQVTPWMSPPVDPQRGHQRSHNGRFCTWYTKPAPLPTTRRSRLAKLVEDHWPCTHMHTNVKRKNAMNFQ